MADSVRTARLRTGRNREPPAHWRAIRASAASPLWPASWTGGDFTGLRRADECVRTNPRGSAQMTMRAWLPALAAIGWRHARPAGLTPEGADAQGHRRRRRRRSAGARAAAARRSDRRADHHVAAAFRRRRARAEGRPSRSGPQRVRPRARRPARVARTAPGPSRGSARSSIAWSTGSTPTRMTALAQGDGFAEKKDEPASIDELLKIATFPKPRGRRRDRRGGQGGPRVDRARHPDPAELAHPSLRRAVPGPAARLHRGEPDARRRSTCR